MVAQDCSKSLGAYVGNILQEYDAGAFHHYWELSRDVIGELPVRKFYVHHGQSYDRLNYLNVAILADRFVIDIEGAVRTSRYGYGVNDQGGFVITPLKSIEAIEFHVGRLSTIQESSNAKIILIASILGDSAMGKYWIADTDEEYQYLVQFGKSLMELSASH